jgi:hypothetical protein
VPSPAAEAPVVAAELTALILAQSHGTGCRVAVSRASLGDGGPAAAAAGAYPLIVQSTGRLASSAWTDPSTAFAVDGSGGGTCPVCAGDQLGAVSGSYLGHEVLDEWRLPIHDRRRLVDTGR